MSNNYPPDYSGNEQRPAHASGTEEEAAQNPYMRGDQASRPNLDEGAPTLTVNEVRQLNRKALLFLAGIVAMMVLMAFWFVNSLSNREKPKSEVAAPPQIIETPELPESAPEPVRPIEVAQEPPPLPPLPPSNEQVEADYDSAPAQSAPSLRERRMGNADTPPGQGMPQPAQTAVAELSTPKTSAKRLKNPDALLVRGTYIRCVLETRIVTELAGNTSCIVSEPIYSINGRSMLLPVGTKLLGTYGGDSSARDRVAVVWDRAITPTGLDVSMSSPGVDNLGGSGHPGQRDAHWANRITTAVLVSLISDVFKYAGEKHGPRGAVYLPGGGGAIIDQPFQSNTARTVESLAKQAVEESALRRPTITINQGSMLNVYVSQDVDFTGVLSGG